MSICTEALTLKPEGVVINPEIIQQTTWALSLQWLDSDNVANDLTSATAKLSIKDISGAQLIVLTETAGITLGGLTGNIDVLLTSTQTATLPLQRLRFNLDINTGTEIKPIARGEITVRKNANITPT